MSNILTKSVISYIMWSFMTYKLQKNKLSILFFLFFIRKKNEYRL